MNLRIKNIPPYISNINNILSNNASLNKLRYIDNTNMCLSPIYLATLGLLLLKFTRYTGPMSLICISELICCLCSLFADKSALLPVVFSRQLSTLQKCKEYLYFVINPLNAELNPICHLLALLGGATIVVFSRLRVKHGIEKNIKKLKLLTKNRYKFCIHYNIDVSYIQSLLGAFAKLRKATPTFVTSECSHVCQCALDSCWTTVGQLLDSCWTTVG
jgi:hypothetical protein